MTIQGYNISCDKKVVDKTSYYDSENPLVTLTGVKFKDDVNIIDPVLYVNYNEDLFRCNYFHIGTVHRFYFLEDIITTNNGLYLKLHEDVLMSYLGQIKNMSGIVSRQEKRYDMYLNDKAFKTDNYNVDVTINFPNTGQFFTQDNASFVLAVAGPKGGVT